MTRTNRSVDQSVSLPSFIEHAARARSVDMCHTIGQLLSPSAKQVCVWHLRLHALTTVRVFFFFEDFVHIRTFFCAQRDHSVLHTLLMRVTHTRMAQVHEKGVCRMSVFVISYLTSHPSFALSVRRFSLDFPVHTFLPYSLVLKAQGMRISARGREVLLSGQVRPQHISRSSRRCTYMPIKIH